MLGLYAALAVVLSLILVGVLVGVLSWLGVRSRRRAHAREVLLRAIAAVAALKDSWDHVSRILPPYGCEPRDLESFLAAVGPGPGRRHLRAADAARVALTRAAEHATWLRPYYLDDPEAVYRDADRITAQLYEAVAAQGHSS
jgi:hypothetical protein